MTREAVCVSICAETAAEMRRRGKAVAPDADLIEFRLDCLRPDELPVLLADLTFPKPVVLTRRPVEQGGHWDADRERRIRWWAEMHSRLRPDGIGLFFDVELDINAVLHAHSQGHIVSFHDFAGVPEAVDILLEEMFAGDANAKIAWSADDICDTIPAWTLLETARETGRWVSPIAMGECGKWTRILGPALGARMTYASEADGRGTAPGQISGREMKRTYRVDSISERAAVYGIIGGDTSYSLSPHLHNAVFAERGDDAVFVPLQTRDLGAFFARMVKLSTREVGLNFKGFAVTNPHKTSVMSHLDEVDDGARRMGAVNTVRVEDGRLIGSNTDAEGFIRPLRKFRPDLGGLRAAVLGAGGAARACVHALASAGCRVTVFAREESKAAALAADFGAEAAPLAGASLRGFDVAVNATPLGTKGPSQQESPLGPGALEGPGLAYDLVYNPTDTPFLRSAREAGLETIGGLEMLLEQAALQQKLWTGLDAPLTAMRRAALERLA